MKKKLTVLEANTLRLVDAMGRERVLISACSSVGDIAGIWIKASDGTPLLEIQISNDASTIRVANASGSNAIQIGASRVSNGVTVSTEKGEGVVSLSVDHDNNGPFRSSEGYVLIRDVSNGSQTLIPPR